MSDGDGLVLGVRDADDELVSFACCSGRLPVQVNLRRAATRGGKDLNVLHRCCRSARSDVHRLENRLGGAEASAEARARVRLAAAVVHFGGGEVALYESLIIDGKGGDFLHVDTDALDVATAGDELAESCLLLCRIRALGVLWQQCVGGRSGERALEPVRAAACLGGASVEVEQHLVFHVGRVRRLALDTNEVLLGESAVHARVRPSLAVLTSLEVGSVLALAQSAQHVTRVEDEDHTADLTETE